jgi:hypothetical protein
MGMTYRAYRGKSNMLADIPGVPTAPAHEGRLCPKGRLCQQPAGDSIEESWSRAQKIRFLQRWDRQKQPEPDKIDRSQDGSDARHDQAQPISDRGSFPTKGSEASQGICPSDVGPKGKRRFIKHLRQSRAKGSCRGCGWGEAGSQANRHLPCNQTLAYIRGPRPLVWGEGDPIIFFLL